MSITAEKVTLIPAKRVKVQMRVTSHMGGQHSCGLEKPRKEVGLLGGGGLELGRASQGENSMQEILRREGCKQGTGTRLVWLGCRREARGSSWSSDWRGMLGSMLRSLGSRPSSLFCILMGNGETGQTRGRTWLRNPGPLQLWLSLSKAAVPAPRNRPKSE